ncbi:MAG: NAD-dependent epimerase/dehydratase family protein [Lewinellaceae bacterium]|nr:NAD-dependent epimerase/dehydratase family protein [Lewinellaceae bacterium]
MIIAVTGATGLLGAALCRHLVRDGYQVRCLVRQNDRSLLGLPLECIQGNLQDPASLDRLCSGAEVVFHVAGLISIGQMPESDLWQTNVVGTEHVVAASQKASVRRMVFFSSVHAFEAVPPDRVFDETASPATRFPYERSKAAAQALVLKANGIGGLETISLNPTSVLGPWDFKPSLQGQMLLDFLAGRIPVLTPGGFDWVDSRDVAAAAVAAMTHGHPGEAYLISGRFATLRELAQLIGKVSQRPMPSRTLPFWFLKTITPVLEGWSRLSGRQALFTREALSHVESGHPAVSHAKASRDFGYKPRPLEETVQDMYSWFLDHYLK